MGFSSAWVLSLALLVAGGGCTPKEQKIRPQQAEFVIPGPGNVKIEVLAAQKNAIRDSRTLVVYVGAKWCEPCNYFSEAVKNKSLPAALGHLRFLKFDSDVDDVRLQKAGYGGEMIPRFVIPAGDGRGSDKRFEGSIKGPGAVENIVDKLGIVLPER